MAIYLLNISVDTTDAYPENIPEDLSINDQESVIEIVLEQILGFENAIEEYDDCDSQNQTDKKSFKNNLLVHPPYSENHFQFYLTEIKIIRFYRGDQLCNSFLEIDSPPPKA